MQAQEDVEVTASLVFVVPLCVWCGVLACGGQACGLKATEPTLQVSHPPPHSLRTPCTRGQGHHPPRSVLSGHQLQEAWVGPSLLHLSSQAPRTPRAKLCKTVQTVRVPLVPAAAAATARAGCVRIGTDPLGPSVLCIGAVFVAFNGRKN